MKRFFLFLITIIFIMMNTQLNAQNIRPIRDNVGFCWTPAGMDSLIALLGRDAKGKYHFSSENLVAGISPHDDYLYAGKVYFPLYRLIKAKEVVIFGVTHGTVRKAMNNPKNVLILDNYSQWQGPYKNVQISPLRKIIKKELDKKYYMVSNKAQRIEHSIEALIPFLQYYNRDIKITPIMVTEMDFQRMKKISTDLSGIIVKYMHRNHLYLGKDVFFLISTDANHYGEDFDNSPYGLDKRAHELATKRDKQIAEKHFNGEITNPDIYDLTKQIWPSKNSKKIIPLWCGRYPIVFGLLTTTKVVKSLTGKSLTGKLFKYSDTETQRVLPIKDTNMGTTAPFSYKHWVGFFSAGFYLQ